MENNETTGNQWHLQRSALWFEMTVMKMKNNIRRLAWDDKTISSKRWNLAHSFHRMCEACLYFCNVFIENFIHHIGILNQNQTCAQNAGYMPRAQTPTVARVLSLKPADPNKSPLYLSIQGLTAACACVSCPTTNLYAWGSPPTELISPCSPGWAASLTPPSRCTHAGLIYALALHWLWFPPH